jgi:hypothetical protein
MQNIARTEEEVNDVLNWAAEGEEEGTKYRGMSYEQGIRAGIEWLLGDTDDRPDIT